MLLVVAGPREAQTSWLESEPLILKMMEKNRRSSQRTGTWDDRILVLQVRKHPRGATDPLFIVQPILSSTSKIEVACVNTIVLTLWVGYSTRSEFFASLAFRGKRAELQERNQLTLISEMYLKQPNRVLVLLISVNAATQRRDKDWESDKLDTQYMGPASPFSRPPVGSKFALSLAPPPRYSERAEPRAR